jgi:hypothetical protein
VKGDGAKEIGWNAAEVFGIKLFDVIYQHYFYFLWQLNSKQGILVLKQYVNVTD